MRYPNKDMTGTWVDMSNLNFTGRRKMRHKCVRKSILSQKAVLDQHAQNRTVDQSLLRPFSELHTFEYIYKLSEVSCQTARMYKLILAFFVCIYDKKPFLPTQPIYLMGRAMRKCVFGLMRTAKAQFRLRIRAV